MATQLPRHPCPLPKTWAEQQLLWRAAAAGVLEEWPHFEPAAAAAAPCGWGQEEPEEPHQWAEEPFQQLQGQQQEEDEPMAQEMYHAEGISGRTYAEWNVLWAAAAEESAERALEELCGPQPPELQAQSPFPPTTNLFSSVAEHIHQLQQPPELQAKDAKALKAAKKAKKAKKKAKAAAMNALKATKAK